MHGLTLRYLILLRETQEFRNITSIAVTVVRAHMEYGEGMM